MMVLKFMKSNSFPATVNMITALTLIPEKFWNAIRSESTTIMMINRSSVIPIIKIL